ncbi:MAG TPA: GFA family protein [Candidatus Binatia bacterium]|nr:GFA family protein [Candidatus Binatia bacterium]
MVTGRCQCGAVRYRHSALPVATYVCHCRECQKQSASAFGISVEMPAEGLVVTQGSPKFWSRDTDSGRKLRCAFCPDCGSRLWHESDAGWITLKGGSLDTPPDLSAAIHIWTKRKLPGVVIPPNAQQFPGEPD